MFSLAFNVNALEEKEAEEIIEISRRRGAAILVSRQ